MLKPIIEPGKKLGVRTVGHYADRRVFYVQWEKFQGGAPLVDVSTKPLWNVIPKAYVNVAAPGCLSFLGMVSAGFDGPAD